MAHGRESAGYLLGSLRPGDHLLDVGCGPGTVTVDLACRVAPGSVVGLDAAEGVVAQARTLVAGSAAIRFVVGDVYRLDFPDATFDVVHAHQVLQHLAEPVAALREMRRVLRPGGLLAVRDSDYAGFVWAPGSPELDRWNELYHQVARRNGGEPDAGRHLPGWVRAAGFADPHASGSTWTFADLDSRRWWGGLWADRLRLSALADQALAYGLADRAELDRLADAWRAWAEDPDGFFLTPHCEVLARR